MRRGKEFEWRESVKEKLSTDAAKKQEVALVKKGRGWA